jgi:hypothetical protein
LIGYKVNLKGNGGKAFLQNTLNKKIPNEWGFDDEYKLELITP